MSSRLPSSCRALGSVDRGSVSGARPAGSSSERRHLRRDRTMERIAYMLRLLPLLALGALAVAGCDDAYAPLSGPRADASVLMHQELRQEDRFGLPAIATVFIPTDLKDAYNEAVPAGDAATFRSLVVAKLMAFGQDAASAKALAGALTPDIQPIDVSQPTGFLNGRKRADHAFREELSSDERRVGE